MLTWALIDPCPCPARGDGSFSANEKLQMNGLLETTLGVIGKVVAGCSASLFII